jgi:flagellar motility protein MotE (MotC chaperone)
MQKNTIEKELHNTRKKMNERLDRLEKNILGQLNANYRRLKSEMDHVLKDLDYRKQGVKSLQNALAKAKNSLIR